MENDLIEIESKLNYPEVKVREYCDKIKNQIDLNTDTLIEKIKNFREQLLNELNVYEQSSIQNLKYIDKKEIYIKLLRENAEKLHNYYTYINQSRIDEQQVRKMINEAKIQEYKLKNNIKLLNGKLFGKNLITFEQSTRQFDCSLIGKLNYENLSVVNDLTDIEKVVDTKIEKTIEYKADMVLPILTNKYLVASGYNLKIIDDNPDVIVEIRFDNPPLYFSHNNLDSILVQHRRCIWKNNRKEVSPTYTLSVYDFNLNLKNEISIDYNIMSCVTNNHNIFVQTDRSNAINVYSWDLEKIVSFGQTSYVDRPYFFKDFMLKMVKNDKIYMRKINVDDEGDFWIRIVSLTNGELLNEYYLDCNHENFFVDALSRTIVIDDVFSNLRIYEKPSLKSNQADLIFEKNLDLTNCSGFQMTLDGKFFFVRNKQFIQYFSFSA